MRYHLHGTPLPLILKTTFCLIFNGDHLAAQILSTLAAVTMAATRTKVNEWARAWVAAAAMAAATGWVTAMAAAQAEAWVTATA
jgi:hypothetical protein